jgi:hypothetical protein
VTVRGVVDAVACGLAASRVACWLAASRDGEIRLGFTTLTVDTRCSRDATLRNAFRLGRQIEHERANEALRRAGLSALPSMSDVRESSRDDTEMAEVESVHARPCLRLVRS